MAVPVKSKKKLSHTNIYLLNQHHAQFLIPPLVKYQASSFFYNVTFQSIPQAQAEPTSTEAANPSCLSKEQLNLPQEDSSIILIRYGQLYQWLP